MRIGELIVAVLCAHVMDGLGLAAAHDAGRQDVADFPGRRRRAGVPRRVRRSVALMQGRDEHDGGGLPLMGAPGRGKAQRRAGGTSPSSSFMAARKRSTVDSSVSLKRALARAVASASGMK